VIPTSESDGRRRRLGFVVAATIAVLAVAVAAFPVIQDASGPGTLDGPAIVPRPFVVAFLLGLPAGLAAIAALRGSRPMFVAAGVVCLLQSMIALSGVTLGFLIPGLLLVAHGLERTPSDPPSSTSRREWFAAIFIVALGIAAWVVPLATTETACWVAREGPDGNPVNARIPVSNTRTVGADEIASGCDGGTFTLEGLMAAAVLGIGALSMAGLAVERPLVNRG
jgi:hypothetical protein